MNTGAYMNEKIIVYSKYGPEYVPACSEDESAGYDIICPVDITLTTRAPAYMLDLGIVLDGPKLMNGWKWHYKIIPRSSSSKQCLSYANTIGVIDSSYRGPEDTLKVALLFNPPMSLFEQVNLSRSALPGTQAFLEMYQFGKKSSIGKLIEKIPFMKIPVYKIEIKKGDRIGQLVFQPMFKPELEHGGSLEDHPGTDSRGGFGSTGA
jgi:dUTPase